MAATDGNQPMALRLRGRPFHGAQRAAPCPETGKRSILGEPCRTEHLDGAIKPACLHVPCNEFDRRNVGVRRFIDGFVHQPGRAQHEKPRLADFDSRFRDPVPWRAEGKPALCPRDHQFERQFAPAVAPGRSRAWMLAKLSPWFPKRSAAGTGTSKSISQCLSGEWWLMINA